jgi:hypothetical protein
MPPHLRPPIGFHIATFVGALLSTWYCGYWPLVGWYIGTGWLIGLFDDRSPKPPPSSRPNNCPWNRQHHRDKQR